MQELSAETEQFLADLQTYAGRQLHFPREVGYLLDLTRTRHLEQVFRDAIFHAKFAVKSKEVMTRIGTDGEGFDKLAAEFQSSIEKTSALLRTVVKEAPEEVKKRFVADFFSLDQRNLTNFVLLLEDLAWIKNWQVDGKPLPIEESIPSSGEHRKNDGGRGVAGRVRKSSILAVVLMVVLLVADPPVSVLGWGAAILVCVLLLFIVIESRTLSRN